MQSQYTETVKKLDKRILYLELRQAFSDFIVLLLIASVALTINQSPRLR